jgi:hypothetical protein
MELFLLTFHRVSLTNVISEKILLELRITDLFNYHLVNIPIDKHHGLIDRESCCSNKLKSMVF